MQGGQRRYDTYQALRWPFGRRLRAPPSGAVWRYHAVREVTRLRAPPPGWELARRQVDEAALLEDLAREGENTARVTLILCRALALRAALRAATGPSPELEVERTATVEYIEGCRAGSVARELEVLAGVARLAGAGPSGELARSLLAAGSDAVRHGHGAGAFECYRAAFDVAVTSCALVEGAAAASALAQLSAGRGSRHATRAWRRRARALTRRDTWERREGRS